MRKMFLVSMMLLSLIAMGLIIGCSDDDDNPVGPGDPNDPSYNLFLDEFEGLDDMTGEMFDWTLGFMNAIFETDPPTKPVGTADTSSGYHSGSGFWVVTADMVVGEGGDEIHFNVVDSIQFSYGAGPVHYPDPDSVTQVLSYLTVTLAPGQEASGTMFQNVSFAIVNPGSDTLTVNATGGFDVASGWQDVDGTDTTNCDIAFDYDVAITNLVVDIETLDSDSGCPISGVLTYTGAVDLACTGANQVSLSGNWNVQETFADQTITIVVTSGDNEWTVTDTCY